MAQIVLIDSSAWIEALRKDGRSEVRQKVQTFMFEGRAAWSDIILLELWNGAQGIQEIRFLEEVEREVQRLETNVEVWKLGRELSRKCRQKGFTIPPVDLLIAACAEYYHARIEHCDEHFNQIAKVIPS